MIKDIFKDPRRSLVTKLILTIGTLMTIGSLLFWYAILYRQEKDITTISVKFGESSIDFVRESARHSMLTFHAEAIQQTLENIARTEGVKKVRIFDHKGKIFYSSHKEEVHNYVDKNSIACKGCHLEPEKSGKVLQEPQKWLMYKGVNGQNMLKTVGTIINEPSCYTAACHIHSKDQTIIGFIETDTSFAHLASTKVEQGIVITGYIVIFIIVLSVSLCLILWNFVTKPLTVLVHGMEQVAAGNLDHPVSIISHDEIGTLGKAFNSMIKDLKTARDQRESWTRLLEAEVAKKTEEIQRTHAQLVQTEKLASLGRMAAGVAHEINNPLTGIVTFAHLLKKRFPPESPEAEDLNIIIEQSERCAKIIKNLLTFARATPSEKGQININDILSRTLYMVKNQARFHDIKFNIGIEDTPFIVLGDASQFQQIFLNMFINAADAMNEKGTITVATRRIIIDSQPFVEIEFTDTGSGIPEEIMEKLFEPFFTTKPVGKGTGLGLAVSHGIVKQCGGQIDVKSTVGKGTSFFVKLPLVE